MEGKRDLRARFLAARDARTPSARVDAGEALAAVALGRWRHPGVVAAYAGVGTEPPTRPMLDALVAAGATVLLPVVTGAGLTWAAYEGWERLVPGPAGLLEPASGASAAALDAAELVLAPALAVDEVGTRLGRGAGYYDRALAGRDLLTVAVVYDDEVVERLPAGPHDVPVTGVLTPSGVRLVRRD